MPHFEIVDESKMEPREAMLLRAKVHLRSARRRLRDGLVREGVATLYDAVDSSMVWYAMDAVNRAGLTIGPGEDTGDADTLCRILVRSGILSGMEGYAKLAATVEMFLLDKLAENAVDTDELLAAAEQIILELGVLPFDEAALPPEHPSTR